MDAKKKSKKSDTSESPVDRVTTETDENGFYPGEAFWERQRQDFYRYNTVPEHQKSQRVYR